MTLVHILVLALLSLLAGWVLPFHWRLRFLWAASLLAVFIFQPASPIRSLDFWLPLASIGLTLFVWAITAPKGESKSEPRSQADRATFALTAALILLVSLPRYLGDLCCITPTRPPTILSVTFAVLLAIGPAYLIYRRKASSRVLPWLAILLILALFVILKYPPLGQNSSAALRILNAQDPSLAGTLDLAWLGFSYLAFRLLHVLRDYQAGKLPPFTAAEFTIYALFYPSLTAGPIDRSQRFIQNDLRCEAPVSTPDRMLGVQRILIGIFKKFVIADALALVALNPANALLVESSFWLWLLLYAYALRIYFDFSGYIDVALGIALLVGVRLPENFTQPYLKTNLTAFWNSWNITLAQWLRAYVFNPLTRWMRSGPFTFPVWVVILTGQTVTMLLLGLWHGITWNYAIWGLWHAAGLFIHNRWNHWILSRSGAKPASRGTRLGLTLGGWFLTFQFVTLGWVWFALPDVESALQVFTRLFRW